MPPDCCQQFPIYALGNFEPTLDPVALSKNGYRIRRCIGSF